MKLNVFLIILGVLLLSCLGSRVQESFDLGQDLANLGGDVAQGIGNVAGGVAHGVGDVVGGTARGVGDVVGGTARGVGDVVGGVGQGLGDVVGGVGGALGLDDLYDGEGSGRGGFSVTEEEEPRRRRRDNRWILRSKIVPPVCPKCPDIRTCRQTPCPACPPCARCPEPAFTCEKVPNYRSRNDMYLPRPVLADFSQFGM